MTAAPVIITQDLTRRFGDLTAVDRLTLEVQAGEIFGLLGHNGAGKTTTVRLLNGVLAASAGSARVLGLSPAEQGTTLRRKTGVLTETPSLYETLSARENLMVFAELYDVPADQVARRVDEILVMLNLKDRAREKVGGYSKGMKQRLALARAFLHQPDLLFLDEPTAGLDPVAAKEVNDLILHLSRNEGKTILLATHYLHDAQRLCDRVAVLEHGRLIALGTPAELGRQYRRSLAVEIEIDPAQVEAAIAALRPFAGSIESEKSVLKLSNVAHECIPDALAALVGAGVRVYRIMPNEPTLEDVYFALQGKAVPS
jgi:ABC-2 type transport system ATP-binding protein